MIPEGKYPDRSKSPSPRKFRYTKTDFDKNTNTNINSNNINNNSIKPVKLISNEPLYSLKETLICAFCGGKNCKHENFRNHKNPAIYGLNSDKIDDNIFASQRPANSLIREYNLISKFKELNIGFIVNLQLPGEHPYCGPDKLDESGFSYSPSIFESEGIHVGLYGWKDMNVPNSLNHMLEIVKTMYYYIHNKKKKVLVHCHAGYGRTGITIACFKIFDESITAEVAKNEIRKIRPKCIQNKDQLLYCVNFQEFIKRLKANFYLKEKRAIENFLKYQNDLNVGKFKFINFIYNKSVPLFLMYIFDSIIDIKKKNKIDDYSLYKCLNGSLVISENGNDLISTIAKNINNYNWEILYSVEDPIILCELLFKWLKESILYVIDPKEIAEISDDEITDLSQIEKKLKTCEFQTIIAICKFLFIFKSIDDSETQEEKVKFINLMSKYLLGYGNSELTDDESKNVEKLIRIIDLLGNLNKNKYIDISDSDIKKREEKELILSNVYEQLKQYFENKKDYDDIKKSELINNLNSDEMFNSINNLINSKAYVMTSKEKENEKGSKKEEAYANKNNKAFRVSRLGIVKSNNLTNGNNILSSKSINTHSSFKENRNAFKASYKAIDEVEEEKDVPWIREEDC